MTKEEAIRRIKAWNLDSDDMEVLSAVIPELAESEDERIRKTLLRCCDDWEKGQFGCMAKENVSVIRAYLEKQKEQKPAQYDLDVLEKHITKDSISELAHTVIIRNGWDIVEQEQKPAEWSEEDENNLELVIDCIYKFYPDPVMKYKLKEWLKSLRPVKQEWSEEDERILKGIIGLIDHDQHYGVSNNEMISWLKSLRPHWKPSEVCYGVADASKMEQEVDLEKEIDKAIADYSFTKTIDSGGFKTTVIDYAKIARHFYELGLNARKEE